jgi:iron complex outermembrane receptor protein
MSFWLSRQPRDCFAFDFCFATLVLGRDGLNTNHKLAYAISAILGGYAGSSLAATATTAAADVADTGGIEEIQVTAQRRTESIQNVPITIQAITSEQLKQLSLSNFDDVVKYLPNVSIANNGPGMGNIYMRGLSAGFAGGQSSASIAPFPNVASYLDEQSMTFPARNVDVYLVDMERLEVLEGPQGTLFGGGAEAGAVRYITNKPKINVTEGNAEASYGVTAGGDPNTSVNATLNLPLIQDTLAVRGVIYSDRRGGYIDNVASTFTRKNTDAGNFYTGIHPAGNGLCPNGLPTPNLPSGAPGFCTPPGAQNANNFNMAQSNQNPVTYTGIRLQALYQINDDWNVLLAQSFQNMEADGEFTQYPTGSDGQTLKADQGTFFTPSYDKDKFENTAWTVNGKIGPLKAIYTGGYMVRDINQVNDYSNYSRAAGGFYYACTGPGTIAAAGAPTCYSPISSWQDMVNNTHQSHEIRVSTPDDWRMRGIVGAFWEDFEIKDVMNFNYKSIPTCNPNNLAIAVAGGAPCVANPGTAPGSTASDPGARGDTSAFGEDLQRGYKQTAVFGSVDFDIIPKTLTVTAGTRWYHYSEFEAGSQYGTDSACANIANTPAGCTADTHNISAANLHVTYSGFKSRANINWKITPDVMVYYTFSQGFRPGAFNRTVSNVAGGPDLSSTGKNLPQLTKPQGYGPDSLDNNEIGLKSEFFDHRLQVNVSAYHMDWKNVQVLFFDPTRLGNTTFGTNGPNYTVNGLELQLVSRITEGLTVQGSMSYNKSKQSNSPCLIDNIAGTTAFGKCITQVVQTGVGLAAYNNPFGAEGGTPAFSPTVQANLRARYDWTFNEYKAFASAGGNYTGEMFNQTDTAIDGNTESIPNTTLLRYRQPGYTTYDAAIGVGKDAWTCELFGQNLSNSNASVFTSSAQFIKSEVPLRPRVLGLKIGYKF